MWIGIGIIINVNEFFEVCKQHFKTIEDDLNNYITKHFNENTGRVVYKDITDVIIEFLEDEKHTYFSSTEKEFNIDLTIYSWNYAQIKKDNKEKTVFFGSVLSELENNDASKSIEFDRVTDLYNVMKLILTKYNIKNKKIELAVDES